MQLSANLGFLWTDRPLPQAVAAAARAGFEAVEIHGLRGTPARDLGAACRAEGLALVSLNTDPGGPGEFGLSALPGREAEARAAIARALEAAGTAGARAVHVMAGKARGPAAEAAFRAALDHACTQAPPGITVLIEPLNPFDVPGYLLNAPEPALALIRDLGRPNLKLMLDLYHMGRIGRDLGAEIARAAPHLGHVQIAGLPDRGPPGRDALPVAAIRAALAAAGWPGPLGAEYRPPGPAEATLGWMADWR